MPQINLGFRIEGATDAAGRVQQFPRDVLEQINQAAQERAKQTVSHFQREMAREYTSAYATGLLARGITYKTFIKGNGVNVQFQIQDRRELRYVTALLGGHFRQFPVGPFIIRPRTGGTLRIPFARTFLRGSKGQFRGSTPAAGFMLVKQVLWGSRSGGFPRDVLSEVAQSESVLFVEDMQRAVQNAIVTMTE